MMNVVAGLQDATEMGDGQCVLFCTCQPDRRPSPGPPMGHWLCGDILLPLLVLASVGPYIASLLSRVSLLCVCVLLGVGPSLSFCQGGLVLDLISFVLPSILKVLLDL